MREIKCAKCGNTDVAVTYYAKGKLITHSAKERSDSEFHHSSQYDYHWKITADKDHLHAHCRRCQYSWDEKCCPETPVARENEYHIKYPRFNEQQDRFGE